MEKYRVEFTSAENSFVADFNDAWCREIVEADSIVEAVDCADLDATNKWLEKKYGED